jgi:hypothetical protein
MSNIHQIRPVGIENAVSNLAEFINKMRSAAMFNDLHIDFDSNSWDVTNDVKISGRGKARHNYNFKVLVRHRSAAKAPDISEPFLGFMKSYIAYMHITTGVVTQARNIAALKNLYNVMYEFMTVPDPVEINADILNRTTDSISSHYAANTAYSYSLQLQRLAIFLEKYKLTKMPIHWTTYLKLDRKLPNRSEKYLKNDTHKKLPSPEAIEAMAYVFTHSKSASDLITTSTCAILLSAPSRVSELMDLGVDCEIWRQSGDDNKYGLRWNASKGGTRCIKWVNSAMIEVAQKAIQNLKEISQSARLVARWYEDNPGLMYLPKGYEHLRSKKYITSWELAAVLAENATDQTALTWCKNNNVTLIKKSYKRTDIDFESVERMVLSLLPKGFPWMNKEIGLKYSEALFLIRANQLYDSRGDFYGIIEPVSSNAIRIRLGSRLDTAGLSIFEKYQFREIDGSPIKVETHMFRHYLNTVCQGRGLSQTDIAKWSGRININQNGDYDNLTHAQILKMIRGSFESEYSEIQLNSPNTQAIIIARDEFIALKVPTAHTTEYGFCIHDFTIEPCSLFRDCINCTEHVCIKGDLKKEKHIKSKLDETQMLLDTAKNAYENEYSGSGRWVEHQERTYKRLSALYDVLINPDVPMGTVIRLNDADEDVCSSLSNTKNIN